MLNWFLTFNYYGFNWIDVIFICIVLYFAASSRGFFETLFEIVSFLASIVTAYRWYDAFSIVIMKQIKLTSGIAHVAAFFFIWFVIETFLYTVFTLIFAPYLKELRTNPINRLGGYFAGAIHACLISFFIVSMIFAFPVRGWVKQDILQSKTGPYFVNLSSQVEYRVKNVFGGALQESMNFLTVKPKSGETIDLGVKVAASNLHTDTESEQIMLNSVNKERTSRGIPALNMDTNLTILARDYATEMFVNGFFSHTSSVDSTTPADRAERHHIEYSVIGENLAFAPDVYLAHQGLMNSEGHRRNILSLEYSKVGIGVIDGGPFGRMFVQEFSD